MAVPPEIRSDRGAEVPQAAPPAGFRGVAKALKRETAALVTALEDPRTPRLARALALLVVAYALSPIDLIPDALPVVGLLDDLVLLPPGLWLVLRLIPAEVLAEARERPAELRGHPLGVAAGRWVLALQLLMSAGFVVGLWLWPR